MKKILIVSQYFYPENFRVNDIATQLVQRGFDVTVLTGIPNYPSGKFFKGFSIFSTKKEILYQGVKVIRLPIFARGKNKISLSLNYLSYSSFSFYTFSNLSYIFSAYNLSCYSIYEFVIKIYFYMLSNLRLKLL